MENLWSNKRTPLSFNLFTIKKYKHICYKVNPTPAQDLLLQTHNFLACSISGARTEWKPLAGCHNNAKPPCCIRSTRSRFAMNRWREFKTSCRLFKSQSHLCWKLWCRWHWMHNATSYIFFEKERLTKAGRGGGKEPGFAFSFVKALVKRFTSPKLDRYLKHTHTVDFLIFKLRHAAIIDVN